MERESPMTQKLCNAGLGHCAQAVERRPCTTQKAHSFSFASVGMGHFINNIGELE